MEGNEIVTLNLDRPRHLRLTNRVLKRFCANQNCSLNDLEASLQRFDVLVSLAYEMLRLEDPTLTVERCDELLDMVSVSELLAAVTNAIAAGFDMGDANPPKDRKNSVG